MTLPIWLNRLLITWFGLGKVPVAPGTAGSLGALPLCWLITTSFDLPLRIAFATGMTAIAILSTAQDQRDNPEARDPGYVVIDEVVGMLWATVLLEPTSAVLLLRAMAVAFVLFRILDVVKPFPARTIDRRSKTYLTPTARGAGIILDDVVAGIYSAVFLALILRYLA